MERDVVRVKVQSMLVVKSSVTGARSDEMLLNRKVIMSGASLL